LLKYLKDFVGRRTFLLMLFAIFLGVNWVMLFKVGEIPSYDFFRYSLFAEGIINGQLPEGLLSPPLHPLLVYGLGSILKFFSINGDPFVISGQTISFISTILLLYFSFKLLEKFNYKMAVFGVFYLFLSPAIFKFLNWQITEMFYMFLLVASFYFLLNSDKLKSWVFICFSIMTRFEGVLLVFSYLVKNVRIRLKYLPVAVFVLIFVFSDLIYLSSEYFGRILEKIQYLFLGDKIFYFFYHPEVLKNIIIKNILFFLPLKTNPIIVSFLFWIFMIFVFLGIWFLYKREKKFAISLVVYLFVYIFSKGYVVDTGIALPHTRRLLPFIYLINIFALLGFYNTYLLLKENIGIKYSKYIFFISFFTLSIFSRPSASQISVIVFLMVIISFAVISLLKNWHLIEKVIVVILVSVIFTGMYSYAFKSARLFLKASSAEGAFAIAQWLKANNNEDNKVWVFSSKYAVEYYNSGSSNIISKNYPMWLKEKSRRSYMEMFYNKVKKMGVKCILYDGNLPMQSQKDRRDIKEMLRMERRIQDFFRVKKDLFYKGKFVATVLSPKRILLKSKK